MTFENNGCVKAQNINDKSKYETNILRVKPLTAFLDKSEFCGMTEISVAFGKTEFDGITILLEISEENGKRFVYNDGDTICFFLINENIYKDISNLGNKLTPYSIAIGGENIYF